MGPNPNQGGVAYHETYKLLLDGAEIKMSSAFGTFKQAEKIKKEEGIQGTLGI